MNVKQMVFAWIAGLAMIVGLAGAVQALDLYATTTVNLRAGPGTNYAVIGQIRQNEIVTELRCNSTRDWCEIRTRNQQGWVARRFFQAIEGYDPPVQPQPEPTRPVITPRPGGTPEPSPIVCFYTGFNYSGREACAGIGDNYRTLTPAWNNQIRSVRVTGFAEAIICTQANFAGQCAVLNQSVTNLGQLAGQISSYRVVLP